MKKFPVLFLCPLALLFLFYGSVQARNTQEIDVRAAAELLKRNPGKFVVLDVRTPAEFAEGHIPAAKNMDFFGGKFEEEILSLPKDETILVYCRSGKRSAGAEDSLRHAGYDKVLHMHEGIEAWEKAGLPVERADPAK